MLKGRPVEVAATRDGDRRPPLPLAARRCSRSAVHGLALVLDSTVEVTLRRPYSCPGSCRTALSGRASASSSAELDAARPSVSFRVPQADRRAQLAPAPLGRRTRCSARATVHGLMSGTDSGRPWALVAYVVVDRRPVVGLTAWRATAPAPAHRHRRGAAAAEPPRRPPGRARAPRASAGAGRRGGEPAPGGLRAEVAGAHDPDRAEPGGGQQGDAQHDAHRARGEQPGAAARRRRSAQIAAPLAQRRRPRRPGTSGSRASACPRRARRAGGRGTSPEPAPPATRRSSRRTARRPCRSPRTPATTRLRTFRPRAHATATIAIARVSGMKTTGMCTSSGWAGTPNSLSISMGASSSRRMSCGPRRMFGAAG